MDTHAIIVIKYRVHPCASIPCDAHFLAALLCSPRRRTDDARRPLLAGDFPWKKKERYKKLEESQDLEEPET
jgi:hypothetical protein